ncbi:MAG: TonB-dependent receptor [Bacteroidales bacterium]|nr:TonB-dependent receptor [Bacteroidales bacterium]
MRRGILLLLAAFQACMLNAQRDSVINLADVVVRENRIKVPLSRKPAAVSVIDSAVIHNTPGISIADIITSLAGLDIRQRGVGGIQTDISIRGSTFDQVLILVNGVRMSDSQTGHHNFNLPLDPEIIDRIEIFKGSSARVFGQNAFAGAINIITRPPLQNHIGIKLTAGSHQTSVATLSLAANTRTTKNHLMASYGQSSGYRHNTDYRLTNLFYQGEVLSGAGTIRYTTGISDRSFGANGFYSGPTFPDQYEEVTTYLASIEFQPRLPGTTMEMTSRVWWRRNDDTYILIRDNPDFYLNDHTNTTAGATINAVLYSSAGITGTGIEFTAGSIESTRLGERNRNGISFFAEHRFNMVDGRLSITPGLVLNHATGFGTSFLPGIDVGYDVSGNMMLFINSGYTYRVPTFTDMYYNDPDNNSNPDLKPEYSLSHEVGFKSTNISGIRFQTSLFTRKGYNLIDRVRQSETEPWTPVNIIETSIYGVEGELTILPRTLFSNQGLPVTRISAGFQHLSASLTGTKPAFSRFTLDNIRNQVIMSTDFRYLRKFTHTFNLRYIDRISNDNFLLADTRIALNIKKLSVFAEITNLGNVTYYHTWQVIMPGRTGRAGFSWKFPV